jgi:hypothetical protein
LQSQIFDNHQPNYDNNTFFKLESLQFLISSVRNSATRIERDVAIMKRATKASNHAKGRNHDDHKHAMNVRHNHDSDWYDDNECTSVDSSIQSPGVFKLRKDFYAYCELTQDDGNWIVIQKRFDGSVNFFRNWNEYRNGFGNIAGEFWIGLENLYELTSSKLHELLIVMDDFNGEQKIARYSTFAISSEPNGYALSVLGDYSGTAGDSLKYHAGEKFSTYE